MPPAAAENLIRRRLPALLCALGGVLVLGCQIILDELPDDLPPIPWPVPAQCGQVAAWDRDGDGISDSIETNNAREGYLALDPSRCDPDPSAPRGSHRRGSLRGGVNLTDRGTGYLHLRGGDRVDRDDWGTLELVNCLEAASRTAHNLGRELGVLDMSLRRGGHFPPHRNHQNGLDADVRYLRRDRRQVPLDLRTSPRQYDASATRQLMNAIVRHCDVRVIYVDLPRLGFGNRDLTKPVLVHASGHSNHFHLSLEKP